MPASAQRAHAPVDAVVVGSGFGGSVVAARLAQRGLRVLVLERGPWWVPGGAGAAGPDTRAFPRGTGLRRLVRNVRWSRGRGGAHLRLRTDGLWEWHAFEGVHALTASGVGGGSLVYTNIQERPDATFFEAFPDELAGGELDRYFAAVRATLRPGRSPHVPAKVAAFEHALSVSGLGRPELPELAVAWGPEPTASRPITNAAGVAQGTCVNVGECVMGCVHRAKTSLDLTYVPLALRAGADVRPLCEVVAVGGEPGAYRVRWQDHRSGARYERTTPRLVLAAGTLNTVRLLLEARDRHGSLPGLPASLGAGFSTNGDLLTLVGPGAVRPGAVTGPTVSVLHRARRNGGTRYVIGEAALPVSALPLPRRLRRHLGASTALLGMGREAARGRLWWDGRGLRADAGRFVDPGLYDEMEQASDLIAAGYGRRWARAAWPGGPGRGPLLTVHPIGGAAIGRGPGDGVCDHRGQVFGHPGLYVADGALYPAAPGVPPSLTIAALAERIAALMP